MGFKVNKSKLTNKIRALSKMEAQINKTVEKSASDLQVLTKYKIHEYKEAYIPKEYERTGDLEDSIEYEKEVKAGRVSYAVYSNPEIATHGNMITGEDRYYAPVVHEGDKDGYDFKPPEFPNYDYLKPRPFFKDAVEMHEELYRLKDRVKDTVKKELRR